MRTLSLFAAVVATAAAVEPAAVNLRARRLQSTVSVCVLNLQSYSVYATVTCPAGYIVSNITGAYYGNPVPEPSDVAASIGGSGFNAVSTGAICDGISAGTYCDINPDGFALYEGDPWADRLPINGGPAFIGPVTQRAFLWCLGKPYCTFTSQDRVFGANLTNSNNVNCARPWFGGSQFNGRLYSARLICTRLPTSATPVPTPAASVSVAPANGEPICAAMDETYGAFAYGPTSTFYTWNYTVPLACRTANWTISAITFASYGKPQGDCNTATGAHNFNIDAYSWNNTVPGSFNIASPPIGGLPGAPCHISNSTAIMSALCVGRSNCTITGIFNEVFGDPCFNIVKRLAVAAICTTALPTPTQTSTPTQSSSVTGTPTRSQTSTGTQTGTSTQTATSTQSGTPTQTPSRTGTPSRSQTGTQSATPTQTSTPTQSGTATQTRTATQTISPTRTSLASISPAAPSAGPSVSPSNGGGNNQCPSSSPSSSSNPCVSASPSAPCAYADPSSTRTPRPTYATPLSTPGPWARCNMCTPNGNCTVLGINAFAGYTGPAGHLDAGNGGDRSGPDCHILLVVTYNDIVQRAQRFRIVQVSGPAAERYLGEVEISSGYSATIDIGPGLHSDATTYVLFYYDTVTDSFITGGGSGSSSGGGSWRRLSLVGAHEDESTEDEEEDDEDSAEESGFFGRRRLQTTSGGTYYHSGGSVTVSSSCT